MSKKPHGGGLQVHRFRDWVAVYIGSGATRYLSLEEAEAFATAIRGAVLSCRTERFTESSCGTFRATISDKGDKR